MRVECRAALHTGWYGRQPRPEPHLTAPNPGRRSTAQGRSQASVSRSTALVVEGVPEQPCDLTQLSPVADPPAARACRDAGERRRAARVSIQAIIVSARIRRLSATRGTAAEHPAAQLSTTAALNATTTWPAPAPRSRARPAPRSGRPASSCMPPSPPRLRRAASGHGTGRADRHAMPREDRLDLGASSGGHGGRAARHRHLAVKSAHVRGMQPRASAARVRRRRETANSTNVLGHGPSPTGRHSRISPCPSAG